MSDVTWKEEFYPIEAGEWNGNAKDSLHNQIGATKHSLQKWKGLRKNNLKNHELENPPIEISSVSCALCALSDGNNEGGCDTCPLYRSRDKIRCDESDGAERCSPFHAYASVFPSNPEPMIRELERTLEMLEKELKDEQSKSSSEAQ